MEPRTLVLTPGMQPHRIVSWHTAICDWYSGKVEIVASYTAEVSSPSITMKIPAVVRCLRATPSMKKAVKFSRMNVYARDGYRCQYCGVKLPMLKLNYDHVVPRSRGGKTCFTNVTSCCYPCNRRKGNRTPHEAGMTLLSLPVKPKKLPVQTRIEVKDLPEVWSPYIASAG